MRRPLITSSAGPPPTPPPFNVGFAQPWTPDPTGRQSGLLWHSGVTSPGNGTVTSVRAQFQNGGHDIAFSTMNASRVVRAISTTVSSVAGVSDYSVSLAIQTGDFVGIWQNNGGGTNAQIYVDGSGGGTGVLQIFAAGGKPAVSSTIAAGSAIGGSPGLCLLASVT